MLRQMGRPPADRQEQRGQPDVVEDDEQLNLQEDVEPNRNPSDDQSMRSSEPTQKQKQNPIVQPNKVLQQLRAPKQVQQQYKQAPGVQQTEEEKTGAEYHAQPNQSQTGFFSDVHSDRGPARPFQSLL